MDQNILLLAFVGISCGITLVRSLVSPWQQQVRGWVIISGAILVITAVVYAISPDAAGIAGGILWLIFLLIPSLGSRWVAQMLARQQFQQARRWAQALAVLHPFDGWEIQPEIIRGLALAQQGQNADAIAVFKQFETNTSAMASTARLHLYRLQNRWPDLVSWLRHSPDLAVNPGTINAYVRALGETGDLNGMLATYERFRDILARARLTSAVSLFIFAYTGRHEQVARLFVGALHLYPQPMQAYWLGLSDFAAGNGDRAREELQQALTSQDYNIRNSASYRLEHPLLEADSLLTPQSKQILQQIEREVDLDHRFGTAMYARQARPYATYAQIAFNIAVFGLETIQGGSMNLDTLYRMGALLPFAAVHQGEWWRVIAAMFLHYGILHIAANMIALLVIGPFVEHVLGIRRYLLAYFSAGIGSMLIIVWLTESGVLRQDLLVGASGAIMGLIGAMGAIMYRGWRQEKAAVARQRLVQIVVIVLLQVFIDYAVIPESSLQGHLSGAIIGFLVASLLRHHVRDPRPVLQQSD